jgi:hypothetical protein
LCGIESGLNRGELYDLVQVNAINAELAVNELLCGLDVAGWHF